MQTRKKSTMTLTTILLALVVGSLSLAGCMVGDDASLDSTYLDANKPLYYVGTRDLVPGGQAQVEIRNVGSWEMKVNTTIDPGEAVTLWFLGFNHPELCTHPDMGPLRAQTPHCSALDMVNGDVFGQRVGGAVGDENGHIEIKGVLDFTADTLDFRKNIYWDGDRDDEFFMVLRSHGPASDDPDVLNDQLTLFNGGCPDTGCFDREYVDLYR